MNSSQKPSKGYYSILQFVPDLERAEGANIGVVLFCPERRFLDVMVSHNNDRVRHFFGGQNFDLQRIDVIKASFAERVRNLVSSIVTADNFKLFIDTRANSLRLTDPRPVKVFEPAVELDKLFDLLVGSRNKAVHQPMTTRRIVRKFDTELKQRDLGELVKRDVSVELPLFHTTEIYPFAFKNGQRNLIKPVVFGTDSEIVRQKASRLAIEGKYLSDQNHKLNVIAGFNDRQEREIVAGVLAQFDVPLYQESDTAEFADLIARTAHN